jgi:hypothetical protein
MLLAGRQRPDVAAHAHARPRLQVADYASRYGYGARSGPPAAELPTRSDYGSGAGYGGAGAGGYDAGGFGGGGYPQVSFGGAGEALQDEWGR